MKKLIKFRHTSRQCLCTNLTKTHCSPNTIPNFDHFYYHNHNRLCIEALSDNTTMLSDVLSVIKIKFSIIQYTLPVIVVIELIDFQSGNEFFFMYYVSVIINKISIAYFSLLFSIIVSKMILNCYTCGIFIVFCFIFSINFAVHCALITDTIFKGF